MSNSAIIAIDFDGTCVTHRYPDIGDDIGALRVLAQLQERGHQLILFTVRSGKQLEEAKAWFADRGIALSSVNRSIRVFSDSPKPYFDLLIDDRSLGIPLRHDLGEPCVDWTEVEKQLADLGLL